MKNTTEFKNIENAFQIAPIKKIFRIQNRIIWKKYAQ